MTDPEIWRRGVIQSWDCGTGCCARSYRAPVTPPVWGSEENFWIFARKICILIILIWQICTLECLWKWLSLSVNFSWNMNTAVLNWTQLAFAIHNHNERQSILDSRHSALSLKARRFLILLTMHITLCPSILVVQFQAAKYYSYNTQPIYDHAGDSDEICRPVLRQLMDSHDPPHLHGYKNVY